MRDIGFLHLLKEKSLIQFIKFGIVGLSNTAIAYVIEMLCYYVLFPETGFGGLVSLLKKVHIQASPENVKIVVITCIAFLISVTNSFYWNSRYVFKAERNTRQKLISYLETVLCYAITGIVLSPWLKILLVHRGLRYWLATMASLCITIPLNYLMNKFWAFRGGKP